MKKHNAAVFLNGVLDLDKDYFRRPENDYSTFDIFCADGGAEHAIELGLMPKAVIGDLDSISPKTLALLPPDTEIIRFSVDKDKTDSELLLDYLKAQGYCNIHIFTAAGGRIDHTLANIFLLLNFEGTKIITRTEVLTIAQNHTRLVDCCNHQLSLIPLTNVVQGLNIRGCKFNLENTDVYQGSSLTMSNTIISKTANLSFKSGKLLIVTSNYKNADRS